MCQDNPTGISLINLFAYYFKKLWVLLIGALVGMILLLSYHYVSNNSIKKVEAYEKSFSKYKVELSSLEKKLDNLNLKLGFADEVESVSPIFSNRQIFVSRIVIAVDSDTLVQVTDSEKGNSIVGYEISSFWNNLNVASIFESDLDNDVLKSSIVFEQSGQSASISVYSEDISKAEKYASCIFDAFVAYFDVRGHLNIGYKTITTSVASNNEIATIRDRFVSDKANLLTELFDTEEEIKSLKNSAPSKYHPLKYAAIGLFVGGVVVALVLCVGFVSNNPITSSFDAEKELGIPFLGALFIDNSFFSRLVRKIIGERGFKNKEESIDYLKSNFTCKVFKSIDNKKGITLLTSLKDKEVEKKAFEIKSLLEEEGFESTFVGDSFENPITARTIENNDAVILLFRQWDSKTKLAKMNKDFVIKMDKKVLGFIIC